MADAIGGRPSTDVGRATKKVRRRPKSTQDADDPNVDGDGRQILNQDNVRISYKATLMGNGHELGQLPSLEEDFDLQDGDLVTEIMDGVSSITFSDRVHKFIEHKMSRTVILKLLGSRIGFNALINKITLLWKPKGAFQLMDLENEFYLVRFDDIVDYNNALIGDLWVVYGLPEGFYSECGLYGHSSKGCTGMNETTSKKVKESSGLTAVNKGIQKRVEGEAFGPWMLVERRHHGKARSNNENRNGGLRVNQGGSRFTILEKEDRLN
ncbi:GroES-like zinc-binding alcohol dehydrogenase family protein [Gossypium australe]|uniref:GroES-like zinc-binding alcohol dehydrogenase family protein n=1 Tax=Gossypium australe TaxID=47621 RepID=A0A5B6WU05_9ROSI|nr:GroES-like zinc-binding alcohol dehydrogenase family protein [Gossypium australe]